MSRQAERFRVPRGSHERITGHMERLQTAWIEAVAAAAGCIVYNPHLVDDGIDVLLHHKHECHTGIPERSAALAIQLKATTVKPVGGYAQVHASRKRVKEYAIANPQLNRVFAVLVMPSIQPHWIYVTDRSLSLFGCCYWINLAGITVPDGADSDRLTVRAPLTQILDDVSLVQMMERIGRGGRP